MRQHEERLETLKARSLQLFPSVSAGEFAELCYGEPGLDAEGVMTWWRQGRLIGVLSDSGRIFPVFQVDPRTGRLYDELSRVLAYFDAEEKQSGWPAYLWFTTPRPILEDRIPAQCLADEPGSALKAVKYEDGVGGG